MHKQMFTRLLVETFNDLGEYRPTRIQKLVAKIRVAITNGEYTLEQARSDISESGITPEVLNELAKQ